MKKEEVRKLLGLNSSIDVIRIEEKKGEKYVYIKSNKKKARCKIGHCILNKNKTSF